MKKITLSKEILNLNVKRKEWHLPSKPPFTVEDQASGETYEAHEVIIENAPSMIKYERATDEFSVITHGKITIHDYARKIHEEIE
jgi:hypothetical protein